MKIQAKALFATLLISQFVFQGLLIAPDNYNKRVQYDVPYLTTRWTNDTETYHFRAAYLKKDPLFASFDKDFFEQHMLPQDSITYRNDSTKVIESKVLTAKIEKVLEELRTNQELTDFTILKDREFDRKEFAGCIVLKFNDHPFVLKIFSENPRSFLQPEKKGFIHGCMAKMTGGLNRYLAGFGRIKNLEYAQNVVENTPDLPIKLNFPRKWFWQPTNNRWLEVRGVHFDAQEVITQLPSVYAIIADEIVCDMRLSHIRKRYGKDIFRLCQAFKFQIDPNMKNFRVERNTNKIILIDTENFPETLGFKGDINANSYMALHVKMGMKAIYDCWIA